MPKLNHHCLFIALAIAGAASLLMAPGGCSNDPTAPKVEIVDDIETEIHIDEGYVGVVIDTRPVFRKGYEPATATVAFAEHAQRGAVLDIDQRTNLAVLSFDTDDLTAAELAAFDAGVAATVVVHDGAGRLLVEHVDAQLVLDNSNRPLRLTTSLPYIAEPVALRGDLPYLLQIEGNPYLVELDGYETILPNEQFVPDNINQQLYFVPVAGRQGTYSVENLGLLPGSCWCAVSDGDTWLRFEEPRDGNRADLVLEQEEDGWVRVRLDGTEMYMVYASGVPGAGNVFKFSLTEADRFRFISDHIDWVLADRGTVFNQPIMPPARLDFAYKGTLRNCSSATLEQTVGRNEARTRTTTVGTTESLQLFASASLTIGAKVGFSVTAKVGVDIKGVGEAGEEQTVSGEASVQANVTTSVTTASQNTWSASETVTTEVSYTRTVTVPPYAAIEVYDAVKTIDNVRIPFTQVLRITGTDKDDGSSLTGREIRSQMLFNFVGGVVSAVGDSYVDITFRGNIDIDKLFSSTSNVEELVGACD